jgi:hypothetical protein
MVPVPEELVLDVAHLVHKLTIESELTAHRTGDAGALEPWDDGTIQQYFFDADEEIRSLLSLVSRATLAEKRVTDRAASDFMQLTVRETFEIVRRLRDSLTAARPRRPQLVVVEVVEEPLPSGRIREQRVLTMGYEIARLVRTAEQAEQAIGPPPLSQ